MAAPISGDRLADLNAIAHRLGLAGQQLRQALPARLQRLWAHVVHVHLPAVVQKPKLFGIWPQVAIAVCKSFAGEV